MGHGATTSWPLSGQPMLYESPQPPPGWRLPTGSTAASPVSGDLNSRSAKSARPQRSRYNCPTGLAVLPMMNIEYRPLEATAMSLALYDTPPLTVS